MVPTDMAIFALKETVKHNVRIETPVFLCFLDASKAFDRVNHRILFDKLICRGVPRYLVQVLSFWYFSQEYVVRWGSTVPSAFSFSNGIRQGGLLSPSLFNVYTDQLNSQLEDTKIWCQIAGVCLKKSYC